MQGQRPQEHRHSAVTAPTALAKATGARVHITEGWRAGFDLDTTTFSVEGLNYFRPVYWRTAGVKQSGYPHSAYAGGKAARLLTSAAKW